MYNSLAGFDESDSFDKAPVGTNNNVARSKAGVLVKNIKPYLDEYENADKKYRRGPEARFFPMFFGCIGLMVLSVVICILFGSDMIVLFIFALWFAFACFIAWWDKQDLKKINDYYMHDFRVKVMPVLYPRMNYKDNKDEGIETSIKDIQKARVVSRGKYKWSGSLITKDASLVLHEISISDFKGIVGEYKYKSHDSVNKLSSFLKTSGFIVKTYDELGFFVFSANYVSFDNLMFSGERQVMDKKELLDNCTFITGLLDVIGV